jgi:hypothetical protein
MNVCDNDNINEECNKTISPKGFVLFLKIQGRKDLSERSVVVNAK